MPASSFVTPWGRKRLYLRDILTYLFLFLLLWTKLSHCAIIHRRAFTRSHKSIRVKNRFVKGSGGNIRWMERRIWNTLWISRNMHSLWCDDREAYSASLPFSMPLKPSLPTWATRRPPPIILPPRLGSRLAPSINSSPTKRRLLRPWLGGIPRNSNEPMTPFFRSRRHRFLSLSGWIRSLIPCSRFILTIQLSTSS